VKINEQHNKTFAHKQISFFGNSTEVQVCW